MWYPRRVRYLINELLYCEHAYGNQYKSRSIIGFTESYKSIWTTLRMCKAYTVWKPIAHLKLFRFHHLQSVEANEASFDAGMICGKFTLIYWWTHLWTYSTLSLREKSFYPMLRADSRFWLVNNREIWSRISRLTSSAWDIKTKEHHWWRHNGDSDRRPLSLPLRYDLAMLCLYDDLEQINVIAGIWKPQKCFRMLQILFEHGINSLPLVCFGGYGNLSTLSIAIPRLAFGRAWYCDAACG